MTEKDYAPEHVLNADGTGLFYKKIGNRTEQKASHGFVFQG